MEIVSLIAEIMASMIDIIITFSVMMFFFEKQRKIKVFEYIIWILVALGTAELLEEYYVLQAIITLGVMFGFSICMLKGKTWDKLIASGLILISIGIVNLILIFSFSALYEIPIEMLINTRGMERILLILADKFTLCIVTYILIHQKKKEYCLKKEEGMAIILLIVGCLIVNGISGQFMGKLQLNSSWKICLLIVNLLLFVMEGVIIFLMQRMNEKNSIFMENLILKLQLEQQKQQMLSSEKLYHKTCEIRHDMRHYFTTYLHLLKNGETELVIKEMEDVLEKKLKTGNHFYIKNRIINAVLNEKNFCCEEKNITFDMEISGDFLDEQEMDIAVLLANLLENAIEAEEMQTTKHIKLKIFPFKKTMTISIENYMEQSVLESNPNLVTEKKEKEMHGIGLKSSQEIIKQLNGSIEITEINNYFRVYIII